MLGKLIKHELNATARYFLPLFLIAIVLTPITRFTLWIGNYPGILKFIPTVIVFAYIASLIVIVCASVLLIIHRFYKSMVTGEGYLMHTLPVSMESHILSKLTVAGIWTIASYFVIALSLSMMFFTPERFSTLLFKLTYAWDSICNPVSGFQLTLFIAEVILVSLFSIFTSPLIFYASIAIGQVISKNKVLGSIIGFFIIQFVSQILGVIFMVPFGFYSKQIGDSADSMVSFFTGFFFPVTILLAIITQAILFGITDFIFKKKLNLE